MSAGTGPAQDDTTSCLLETRLTDLPVVATTEELAALLHMSERRIIAYAKAGKLRPLSYNSRRYLFFRDEVEVFLRGMSDGSIEPLREEAAS